MESLMLETGFADLLTSIRKAVGMTQTELANASGIHRQVIIRLEAGTNQPTWPTVVALAKALGCTPNDFLPDGWNKEAPAKAKRRPGRKGE
jgi:transcriptional regulator with XRE-family HTH domain